MTKGRKIQKVLLVLALIISCVLTCFTNSIGSVYASTIDVVGGYTDVLDDLQQDESFDPEDYPVIEDDYSLQVIRLAENNDRQLFVYVYQPNQNFGEYVASSINISLTIGKDLSYENYKLNLANINGVFQKYIVQDLQVLTYSTRYYEIASIFRTFDENIDTPADNGNTINEVVYKVAKRFCAVTTDDGVKFSTKNIDVITITDKYVGFIRYEDNPWDFSTLNRQCDSWFVAFSTDHLITNLIEADVYYLSQHKTTYIDYSGTKVYNGDIIEKYAYLDYSQVGSWSQDGLFSMSYSWDRIQSVNDFINDPDLVLTEDGLNDVKGKQWVLRFTETPYNTITDVTSAYTFVSKEEYLISDVTILQLKFETFGIEYNLGVVDNKQTGDGIPDGRGITFWENLLQWFKDIFNVFKIILIILLIVLLLVILAPILPIIFNALWTVLKTIVNIVVWVISLPFKLVNYISDKRKNKKE